MNQARESYEKRKAADAARIAERESKRLSLKDKVALVISVCAFLISAATAFREQLYVADEVNVVLKDAPLAFKTVPGRLTTDAKPTSIGLINTGTRTAAILDVTFYFVADVKGYDCEKTGQVLARFQTDFKATSVKEKEVITQEIKLLHEERGPNQFGIQSAGAGRFSFPLGNELAKKDLVELSTCLQVRLATASIASHEATVVVRRFYLTPETKAVVVEEDKFSAIAMEAFPELQKMALERSRPKTLISKIHFPWCSNATLARLSRMCTSP
ncbi:hypothetical protein RAD16_23585 [Bradyrhizobium sp. 18BD]